MEKAFLQPGVELMLRMVETIRAQEKMIGRRVPDPGIRLEHSRTEVDGDIRAGQKEERGHRTAVVANGMVLTEVQVGS